MPTAQPAGTIRMIAPGTITDAVFSPDGAIIYTAHGGTITAYNVASGAQVGNWALGTTLGGIDISVDGHTLVATDRHAGPTAVNGGVYTTDYYVYKLDTTSGTATTFTAHVNGASAEYYDVAMLSDGKALLTQNYYGSGWLPLTTLDLSNGSFSASAQNYAQAGILVSTADHTHIAFGPQNISDEPMFVYTTGSGVTASHENYADGVMGYNNGVEAISPTGNFVAQGPGLNIYDGNLHFVTSLLTKYPEFNNHVSGMAFNASGSDLYLLDSTSKQVIEIDTAHWTVVQSFGVETDIGPAGGSYGNVLQLSQDGHSMAVIGSAGLEVINLTTVVANGSSDGNDTVNGTAFDDTLYGFGGNDVLVGGAGGDTMYGGAGDDTYYVDNYNDQVVEFYQGGNDTVYSSVSYNVSGFESLILTGSAVYASGSQGAEMLTGSDTDNQITAYGGNDTVFGAGGNDYIDGGDGDDKIDGGAGQDNIFSGLGNDTVTGGSGADSFTGTLASLSGDTVADLSVGDRFQVYSVDYAGFAYDRDGGILKLGSSPISIGSANVRLAIVNDSSVGGVDLLATTRMTGLGDFDGDGHSDILWRNANGALSTWGVSGNAAGNVLQPSIYNAQVDPAWKTLETLDFNGDGASDILWRHANGSISIWTADGQGGFAVGYNNNTVGNDWRIAAAGDFNGDGKDDLLWQHDSGAIQIWQATGSSYVQNAYSHDSVGASWKVEGMADFNADGKADIFWRNDNGTVETWLSTGTGFTQAAYQNGSIGNDWHIAGLADFDGDGKADILWRHDSGAIAIWTASGSGFAATYHDNSVGTTGRSRRSAISTMTGKPTFCGRTAMARSRPGNRTAPA